MMPKKKIRAISLLSGGLDSILAAKIVKEQGIEVIGFNFESCFFKKSGERSKFVLESAKQAGIEVKFASDFSDYLQLLKKPKHGHGSAMNPCIDCKIFILTQAKKLLKKLNAQFVVTGEVIGQRPMSQRFDTMKLIEKESGLKGKLLRPLSAKLLPPTEPEKKGWVDRKKFFDIHGRSRQAQFELAKKFRLDKYSSPAGGCLLTEKEFGKKLKDLFVRQKKISERDIELLKIGRHFRIGKNKIIVGKNHEENLQLQKLKQKSEPAFEVPDIGSPTTLLLGPKTKKAVEIAAQLTLRYSDFEGEKGIVEYRASAKKKKIFAEKISEKEIEKMRV